MTDQDNYFKQLYGDKAGANQTIEQILCGLQGGNYWEEKQYSSDPCYSEVDSTVFDYYTLLENTYDVQAPKEGEESTTQLYLDHFTTEPGELK